MLQDLSRETLQLLDFLFYGIHLVVIGFNLLGWIWRQTLRLHLFCIILTALSWFVLGIWYGFGYCFITDWQWDIKRELGETDLPASFITHFVNQVIGLSVSPVLIDWLTGGLFVVVAVISVVRNQKLSRKTRE